MSRKPPFITYIFKSVGTTSANGFYDLLLMMYLGNSAQNYINKRDIWESWEDVVLPVRIDF